MADDYEFPLPDWEGRGLVPAVPYVAVKFKDDFKIEYRDGDGERLGFWGKLRQEFPGIELVRLYRGLEIEEFKALIELAQKSAAERGRRYDPPRFFQWFRVNAPARTRFGALADVLRRQPEVEAVYIEQAAPPPAPIPNPETNPNFTANQLYLQAPVQGGRTIGGINAAHAWTARPAETLGTNVNVVDFERGWGFTLPPGPPPPPPSIPMNHPDLPAVNLIPFGMHNDSSSAEHGTNVLGVLCMIDNSAFGVGAGPATTVHVVTPVVSTGPLGTDFDHESALQAVINRLRPSRTVPAPFGDVLLIEHTIYDPSEPPPPPGTTSDPRKQVPLEFIPANFNVIALATQLGITVVEAAGNGRSGGIDRRLNLDDWPPTSTAKPFQPHPDNWRDDGVTPIPPFTDSGAIMVSGANMINFQDRIPWAPSWAPIGGRIDCWGWASSVQTASSTNADGWAINFTGTSAASAMVAGAAIILQSYVLATTGAQLSPREVRRRLCDRAPGVHTAAGIHGVSAPNTPSPLVGVMPNLASLIP